MASTKKYSFPDFENTPESLKATPAYSIQVAQAIVEKYRSGKTAVGASWGTWFTRLRSYGQGRQSSDQYKSFLSGSVSANAAPDNTATFDVRKSAQKGWYNIMWDDIVSFIPNLKSQISGHFAEIDYDIKADNIDADSGAEEERRMMEVFTNTHPVFGSMINTLKQTAGVPIEEPEYIPEGLQELEDLKEEGGFKPPYTQQQEKLILHSENISGWDRFLKDKIIDDILDIGYTFAYPEFEDETCKPKWRYADPEHVIMQYSQESGFQDSDYCGVREKMTISQLKQYRDHILNSNGEKITDEDFAQLARNFCRLNDNPDETEWDSFNTNTGNNFNFDNFKVDVYKTWWRDVEYIKRIEFVNKYGKTKYYDYQDPVEGYHDATGGEDDIEYGTNFNGKYSLKVEPVDNIKVVSVKSAPGGFKAMTNRPGKIKYKAYYHIGNGETLKQVRIRKVYQCWYIDKSDYCIKHGPMPNQLRYEYTEPLLPMVGYRYPHKAITFRCVPVENVYQIAWYRLQNGLAKAMQGIYTINTTLLGDNGKALDKVKVLKAIRENQVLFYKMGVNNVGGTPIPLSYIPGNLAEVIQSEAAIMNMCMKWVEDQTGFSMIALGATPSPETGLGVTERSIQATQKSIMPILTAVRYMKEELAKRTSCMWQAAIQNDERARMEAAKVIGEDGVWILQQAKSAGVQYGVHLVAKPDSDLKAAVMQTAEQAYAKGEITTDEKLYILESINSGSNLKEMRMKLRKMIMKNKMMAQQLNERNIMVQGQQNERLAQVQAQSAQQVELMRAKSKDAEIKTQAMADIAKRSHDSQRKIEEEKAKYLLSTGVMPQEQPEPQQQTNPPM